MECRVAIRAALETPNAVAGVAPVSRTTNTFPNHDAARISGSDGSEIDHPGVRYDSGSPGRPSGCQSSWSEEPVIIPIVGASTSARKLCIVVWDLSEQQRTRHSIPNSARHSDIHDAIKPTFRTDNRHPIDSSGAHTLEKASAEHFRTLGAYNRLNFDWLLVADAVFAP